jgi:hypothetical protein
MKPSHILFTLLLLSASLLVAGDPAFDTDWELVPSMSTEISHHRPQLALSFSQQDDQVTLIQTWGRGKNALKDTFQLATDGSVNLVPIKNRVNKTTAYSTLHASPGSNRTVRARWLEEGSTLELDITYPVRTSQKRTDLNETHTLSLSGDKLFLTYTIDRPSRRGGPGITYTFKQAGSLQGYVMHLDNNWEVKDDLQKQAMLISLQGLANRSGPHLYFVYPEDWPFTYTGRFYDYLDQDRGYTFKKLKTPKEALETFRDAVRGYVVWDKNVRTSLIVAFTVAGLEDAVVVTEEQIHLVEELGLEPVEDFRGQFTGQNDAEIYAWAIDRYWDRCSRDYLIWLGGNYGDLMKPGVADWAVRNRVFCQDLSNNPDDPEERELSKRLLSDLSQDNPDAIVMGWHSYGKDTEAQHVSLTSSYGLVVEGLNTLPNMSFENHIPFSEGFEFKNNHSIDPDKTYTPEDKVYIACIQTDGLGLGAWLKPGRGEIPYAWETIMNYSWMAPGLLEFFYTTATANDYFIGALSGPGYMYPKAVPPDKMPRLLQRANELMQELDIRVFEIMDYSQGGSVYGNIDLPEEVVNLYYENMPEAIGFVNGYVAATTFAHKEGRPFVSYDYYLTPTVPPADAVTDLLELSRINDKRPYFLLMHVRESSSIERVKNILDELPDEFEVIPLDLFLKMAAEEPTYREQYLQE